MKLYNYFRSSASYRVRIALHLKSINFEYIPVHLVKGGGEQFSLNYKKINPISEVPCLVDGDFKITQSMAILEYLDRIHPAPELFPKDTRQYAQVVEVCEIINSGIQPLHNVSVLKLLESRYGIPEDTRREWVHHHMARGLQALEKVLSHRAGTFCFGGRLTAADVFLIPQLATCRRYQLDLGPYPTLCRIEESCLKLEPFKKAAPENQPDAN